MFKSRRQIDRRRVRLLFQTNSAMYLGGIVGVLAYAYVVRNDLPTRSIGAWLGYMFVAFAFRFSGQRYFDFISRKDPHFKPEIFESLHAFGLFLSASGWGVAGSVLLPGKHELVLVLGLINFGLISGAVSAYAISLLSMVAVTVPMTMPLAIASCFTGSESLTTMGLLTGLYAVIMLRASQKRRDFLLQAWKVADEKEELSRALLDTQARATQSAKMAALGQMAAGIAHEINTPLAIIGVCAQSIEAEIEDTAPSFELIREHAAQVDATVTRIAKIVAGLKNFSRADKDDPPREFQASDLVRDTLELCSERFKRQGIELRLELSDESEAPKVIGHSAQLSQVLLNLLNNAADAVESSPVKWIALAMGAHDKEIYLRVTDSGPGIPQALRSRLMEPFFTTKEFGKGTGLGLSVAHGIMSAHGGSLVLDEESERTSFLIRIPLSHVDSSGFQT